jgi:hypothetical protein
MSVTALKVNNNRIESIADKIWRLQEEAQANAREHTLCFVRALSDLEDFAADIADGGDAYPVGVRESARKLGPELMAARLNVVSILGRDA